MTRTQVGPGEGSGVAHAEALAALDVGTSKVAAAVAHPAPSGWRLAGLGFVAAQGMRRGAVVHLDSAAGAIAEAVRQAEHGAGCRLSSVLVGLGGTQISGRNAAATVEVAGGAGIVNSDVERVLAAVRDTALPAGHDLVHVIPRHYDIDGVDGVHDPRGLSGTALGVDAHLVSCHAASLRNGWRAVRAAGVEIEDLALSGIAAAEAVSLPDERELGVAVVDLGAGSADVVVYQGGAPVATGSVPFGGDQVTLDVAMGLRTSLAVAEGLKREHGSADSKTALDGQTLLVPGVAGGAGREVAASLLCEVVAARVEEILLGAADLAKAVLPLTALPAGVVLTGGMAQQRGVLPLARRIFDLPARIGVARAGEGEALRVPACAALAGLLQFAYERSRRRGRRARRGMRRWFR